MVEFLQHSYLKKRSTHPKSNALMTHQFELSRITIAALTCETMAGKARQKTSTTER